MHDKTILSRALLMDFTRPQPGLKFAPPRGRRFPIDVLQEGLHILVGSLRRA